MNDCLCTGGHLVFFFSPLFLYGKSAFVILFFFFFWNRIDVYLWQSTSFFFIHLVQVSAHL